MKKANESSWKSFFIEVFGILNVYILETWNDTKELSSISEQRIER